MCVGVESVCEDGEDLGAAVCDKAKNDVVVEDVQRALGDLEMW